MGAEEWVASQHRTFSRSSCCEGEVLRSYAGASISAYLELCAPISISGVSKAMSFVCEIELDEARGERPGWDEEEEEEEVVRGEGDAEGGDGNGGGGGGRHVPSILSGSLGTFLVR